MNERWCDDCGGLINESSGRCIRCAKAFPRVIRHKHGITHRTGSGMIRLHGACYAKFTIGKLVNEY